MKLLFFAVVMCVAFGALGGFVYGADFPICNKQNYQMHPEIVYDGIKYFVVYDSVTDIWGARVDIWGNVLSRFLIAGGTSQDSTPAVAFDGTKGSKKWRKQEVVRRSLPALHTCIQYKIA